VREELGVEVNIEMLLATTHFYRGQPAPENELVGVVFLCTLVEPAQIRLSAEHTQARWVAAQEAQALLNPVEGGQSHPSLLWIRRLIERAEALRKIIPAQAGVVFGAGTDVT